MTTLTEQQQTAIKCAYADLVGIYQTIIRDDNGVVSGHNWKAHRQSVHELEEAFPDIIEPADLD